MNQKLQVEVMNDKQNNESAYEKTNFFKDYRISSLDSGRNHEQ